MHKSSFMKMQYFKDTYLNPEDSLKILDIGSFDRGGNYNYGIILNEKKWKYQGLDLKEGNNVDIIVKDAYNWNEIEDETYDVIVSGQAFEHIEFWWITLEEIKRVLKPNGLFFLIVPSTGPVHKNPYDCYRFNENAMKAMAKYVNFQLIEYGKNGDKISDPWYDTFLVAKKPKTTNMEYFENKIDTLERKLDLIMKKIETE